VSSATTPRPVLVLDFDGTVCTGDAPVWAYADEVTAALRGRGLETAADTVRDGLRAFLDGAPDAPAWADGYEAVAELAVAADPAAAPLLEDAYRRSRSALADGRLAVTAPEGLAAHLAEIGEHADRVLVTNAPLAGVLETLAVLGLTEVVDAVHAEARKPGGWDLLLPRLLEGRRPGDLLSVGDIWANDLAAPRAAGCRTALIDRFGHAAGPADLVARSFPELYADIAAWSRDPAAVPVPAAS